jgi:N-ATPase, AtpR subunit
MSLEIPIAVMAGLAGGTAYFLVLAQSVRMHLAGASIFHQIICLVIRVTIAGALFWIAAQFGALVLLATLASFIGSRFVVQHNYMER